MDVDRRLERLCERVTLVEGIGSLRRSELCVMSFVALLAGEGHTDNPASASPLIRNFAIPINDALPFDLRQRLKPFAVRILGTNDGRDPARAELLRQALVEDILPRIRLDWGIPETLMRRPMPLEFIFTGSVGRNLEARTMLLVEQFERGMPSGSEPSAGSAMGELLALCMREAVMQEQRAWYRDQAIGLLDRLCDVGAEARRAPIAGDRIARAEERLGTSWVNSIHRLLPALAQAGKSF